MSNPAPKRYGFTGTREPGMTSLQREAFRVFIKKLSIFEWHHGDCRGADAQADQDIRKLHPQAWRVIHPPDNPAMRAYCKIDCQFGDILKPKGYLDRNHDIVDAADILIATPKEKEEQLRSGTWSTVRHARRTHKPVVIIFPDGEIKLEKPQKCQPTNKPSVSNDGSPSPPHTPELQTSGSTL